MRLACSIRCANRCSPHPPNQRHGPCSRPPIYQCLSHCNPFCLRNLRGGSLTKPHRSIPIGKCLVRVVNNEDFVWRHSSTESCPNTIDLYGSSERMIQHPEKPFPPLFSYPPQRRLLPIYPDLRIYPERNQMLREEISMD